MAIVRGGGCKKISKNGYMISECPHSSYTVVVLVVHTHTHTQTKKYNCKQNRLITFSNFPASLPPPRYPSY